MCSSADRVYSIIEKRILENEYLPNENLVESAISKELNVSRSTVKKAMIKLENNYLVNIEANKGTTVRSINKSEVLSLIEIREVLEGYIAYKVAGVDGVENSKEIKLAKENIEKMQEVLEKGDLEKHSKMNDNIHNILYELCPNKNAVVLINQINIQLRKYNKRTILLKERQEKSHKEHEKIIETIISKDQNAAEKAMRSHIRNIRDTIEENFAVLFM